MAAVLAVTIGFLWPIIRISREPGSGSDGTPDECWRLGQIYYNPNDPALQSGVLAAGRAAGLDHSRSPAALIAVSIR